MHTQERCRLTVMSSVLEGGEGLTSGGMSERSRESEGLLAFEVGLEAEETGGDMSSTAVILRIVGRVNEDEVECIGTDGSGAGFNVRSARQRCATQPQ